jgi:hypothetical protein
MPGPDDMVAALQGQRRFPLDDPVAGYGGTWRQRAAPHGLAQLSQRLGFSPEDLAKNPKMIAAAIGEMEGSTAQDKRATAEAVMDQIEMHGGGITGVMKTLPEYDTITMAGRTRIGSVGHGDTNAVIAGLEPRNLVDLTKHLDDISAGEAERVHAPGYVQNFSPATARVQPVRGWSAAVAPSGERVYAPSWAQQAVKTGQYQKFGGEFFVPNEGDVGKKFDFGWDKPPAGLPEQVDMARGNQSVLIGGEPVSHRPQEPGPAPGSIRHYPAVAQNPVLMPEAVPSSVPPVGVPDVMHWLRGRAEDPESYLGQARAAIGSLAGGINRGADPNMAENDPIRRSIRGLFGLT